MEFFELMNKFFMDRKLFNPQFGIIASVAKRGCKRRYNYRHGIRKG